MSGCMLPSANEWMQGIPPISQRRSHLSEKKVKRKLSRKLMTRDPASQGARAYFSYHSSILPLNFLRDNTSASVIQPLQTDTLQSEVAADGIQPPPTPPISPALPRQFGQASTSKVISTSTDSRNDKNDHADPLAQFYEKARAQQKLKEDGVSVNHCLQLLLINVLTMKWSSVGELDIDDSEGGETDNDFPHPIPKRVRSKVYFSRAMMVF
jgi:hypothetical protein